MNQFWSKLRITQKFVGYLLFFTFIPLLITGYASYQISSNILQEEASLFVQTVVTNQTEYLDLQLRLVENLMLNLSGVEEIRDALEADNAQIDTFTSLSTQARIGYILNGYINLGGLVSIDIFTVSGTRYHVGDTLNTDNFRQDLIDELFADAIANGQDVTWAGIGDNVNTHSTHKKVITATKALYRIDPETLDQIPIALLIVNYSSDFLYDHFSNVNLGNDAYIIVSDTSNRAIYHPDRQQIGNSLNTSFVAEMNSSASPSFITKVNGNAESISVATSDFNGFRVVGVVPLHTLVAQTSIIGITTMSVLILASIIALIAAYYFHRNVVVPIRQVTEHFERFGDGKVDASIGLTAQSDDEIGDLVRWFNVFIRYQIARQQAEEELQIAKEAAETANRSKSIFLTNISHELRTPLNVILGFAQLIQNDQTLSQLSQQRIGTILQSGHHLLELINDVLDMSRIEAGKVELDPVSFDLQNTLLSIQNMLSVKAEAKQLELKFFLSDDLPHIVETDVKKLRQVIINLVNNAIKFTEQGHIYVHVSPKARDEQTYLAFVIEDTGIGIAPEDHSRIFNTFSRAQNSFQEGTGLGLPISRHFVELMGGEIRVESEVGRGARFQFCVKVVVISEKQSAVMVNQSDNPTWQHTDNDYTILVAEDHIDSQELMTSLLREKGFRVTVAKNGAEAVEMVKKYQPPLIFMDIQMPVMDGYEAIQKIREFNTDVIIVAVTAGAFKHESQNILAIGGNEVIHKPFEHNHFYNVLFQYMAKIKMPTTSTHTMMIPAEFKDALHQAVKEINVDEVNRLVERIAQQDQATAAMIKNHVQNFRFDLLNNLFLD